MATPLDSIPAFNQGLVITQDGARPTQLFSNWLSSMLSAIKSTFNNQQSQIAIIQQQEAALQAQVALIQAAQAAAVKAQTTADAGPSGTARSGNSTAAVDITSASFVTATSVSLTTVSAGNLTIIGSGPQSMPGFTDLSLDGTAYVGNWQIVENPGAVVVFSGTYTADKEFDGEFRRFFVTFYNNTDTSTVSIPRTTTGSITYALQLQGFAGLTISQVSAYLNVRRS